MVSLFYSEIPLHYKDCYKGCGKNVKWEVEDVMYLLWHLIETEEHI